MYTREQGEQFREQLEKSRELKVFRQELIDKYAMEYIKKHKRCEFCNYSEVYYNTYDYKIVKCELKCNKRTGKGRIRAKLCKNYKPDLEKTRF